MICGVLLIDDLDIENPCNSNVHCISWILVLLIAFGMFWAIDPFGYRDFQKKKRKLNAKGSAG